MFNNISFVRINIIQHRKCFKLLPFEENGILKLAEVGLTAGENVRPPV